MGGPFHLPGPVHVDGVSQQILHFVEQQNGVAAAAEDVLQQDQFSKPLIAVGFAALVIGFADAVQGRPEPGREGSAELGFAGAGRPVDQNVDANSLSLQRAFDEALDMVSAFRDMVKVGPEQIA